MGSRGRGEAFDGDSVEALASSRVAEKGQSDEAKIIRVTKRGGKEVFGILRKKPGKPFGFLEFGIPEGVSVFVGMADMAGAEDGEAVSAQVSGY